ncbi:hypothetical protein VTK56DRAFT_3580 [Thermocarpiscus australiensis]
MIMTLCFFCLFLLFGLYILMVFVQMIPSRRLSLLMSSDPAVPVTRLLPCAQTLFRHCFHSEQSRLRRFGRRLVSHQQHGACESQRHQWLYHYTPNIFTRFLAESRDLFFLFDDDHTRSLLSDIYTAMIDRDSIWAGVWEGAMRTRLSLLLLMDTPSPAFASFTRLHTYPSLVARTSRLGRPLLAVPALPADRLGHTFS